MTYPSQLRDQILPLPKQIWGNTAVSTSYDLIWSSAAAAAATTDKKSQAPKHNISSSCASTLFTYTNAVIHISTLRPAQQRREVAAKAPKTGPMPKTSTVSVAVIKISLVGKTVEMAVGWCGTWTKWGISPCTVISIHGKEMEDGFAVCLLEGVESKSNPPLF